LLALVIVMGVLILAGTTGLVAVVVHRLAHPRPAVPGLASQAAVPVPGQAALDREPAGTRITSLVRQSDTLLAIALTGGGPDRVLVWDLGAGRALTEIRLTP
jgi:hypothetical protein